MAGLNLKVGINVLQATRELRSLSRSIGKIGVEAKKANANAKGLGGSFSALGAAISGMTGLLVQATGALAVFGAGAAAKSALEFTADFEKNLAEINTILGEGGVSIEQYEKQLLDLSTQSSKTLDDLSKGLYQTISAGIPAVDGASGAFAVLEAAQKAAVAGLTSTKDAVDGTVSVLNAYGTDTIFATEVTDKLFTTVRLGRVTFEELSRGIGRVAPIAASAGVSLDDVLAVLIQLTRQGIKPAEAITGLRNILKTLVRPTDKSTKTIKLLNQQLAAIGQEQVKIGSAALREDGLIGVLRNLTEATGGSTEALASIFPNVRALIPAIVSVGEGFEATVGFQQQLIKSTGATNKAFKTIDETFSETVAKLQSNIGRIAALGFKDVLDSINDGLKDLNKDLSGVGGKRSVETIKQIIALLTDLGRAALQVSEFIGTAFGALFDAASVVFRLFEQAEGSSPGLFNDLIYTQIPLAIAAFVALGAAFQANVGVLAIRFPVFAAQLATGFGIVNTAVNGLTAGFLALAKSLGVVGLLAIAGVAMKSLVDSVIDLNTGIRKTSDLFRVAVTQAGLIDKAIATIVALLLNAGDVVVRVVSAVLGAFSSLFGASDLAKDFFTIVKEGFFGVTQSASQAKVELQAANRLLQDITNQQEQLAAEQGYSTFSEALSFADEIGEGKRIDLSQVFDADLTSLSEADSLLRAAAGRAPEISESFANAVPVAREFFSLLEAGDKTAKLTGQEIQARLDTRLSQTTKLSELDRQIVSTSVAMEIIDRKIAENLQEIASSSAKTTGFNRIQANQRVIELKAQREVLKNLDLENKRRKKNADEALRKAKQNKIQDALNKLLEIERRLRLEILAANRKLLEQDVKEIDFQIKLLRNERERAEIARDLALSGLDRLDALRDLSDIAELENKFAKSTYQIITSIVDETQKLREKGLGQTFASGGQDEEDLQKLQNKFEKTFQELNKIKDKTGAAAIQRAKRLSGELKALDDEIREATRKGTILDVREETRVSIEKLQRLLQKVANEGDEFNKKRLRGIISLTESVAKQALEKIKRDNDTFLKSFESDLERKEFKAKLSIVSEKTGQDVDKVLLALRNQINRRLSEFDVDPETVSNSLLKTFERLRYKLPDELAETANASIKRFEAALTLGDPKDIAKFSESVLENLEAIKLIAEDTPETRRFIESLEGSVLKAVGPTKAIADNFLDAAVASAKLDESFKEFKSEAEQVPGKIFDGAFQAVGDLSFNFGEKISGALSGAISKLPGVFKAGQDLIDAKLRDKFLPNLTSDSGFIRGVASGIVGAANIFIRTVGNGILTVANLFVKTIGDILTPIGTAIAAPVQRLIGSLGAAIGVLADTPEEEDRRDRKEALELQRATLAELQRSGASNEQIAQEQAALAALLRRQAGDEPQTAAERLEEEINRSVEAAIRIAEQLGPLVETFFQTVTQKLPEVFPLLVKGLVEALDAFGEYFPTFFEILVQEVVKALPDIIAAIIRLIPALIDAFARGLFALLRGLPGIIAGVFVGIGGAFASGALKALGRGIARIFEPIINFFQGLEQPAKTGVGVLGGAATGAAIGSAFGPAGTLIGAGLGALGGGILSIFHDGGNVLGSMVNKDLAAAYRSAGVQGFLNGGMVGDTLRKRFRASMSDEVPALLQTGEAVLNRSAVANIGGPNAVDAINSGAGIAPNLNVNVGINSNPNGLGQAAAALLPFLIGSINVAPSVGNPVSKNLMGFRGTGGAPLIR